jgi:uncharacterized protein YecT (DUF1311 family)
MKIRLAMVAFALCSALPATAQSPQTQRVQVQTQGQYDRWCRFQGLDHGSIQVCAAYTYEQCMTSRNPGETICFLNPRYEQPRR